MKAEWRSVKLTELGELNRGKSKHRPRNAAHLYGGKYPFIQTGDIKNSGGRITSHNQTYSDEGLSQSRIWPEGTLAITIAANIAESALLTYPACFPDSVVGFIADNGKSDVRFVHYLLQQAKRNIQHQHSGTGSVQDNLNLDILSKLEFLVPQIEIQTSIVNVLSSIDDKIAINTQTNQTLEALAQAIFKSWFVDFDPVKAKQQGGDLDVIAEELGMSREILDLFPDELEESELGLIPKGWSAKPLYETAEYVNGSAFKATDFSDNKEGLPIIKIAELKQGISAGTQFTTNNVAQKYFIDNGDVLYSWSGMN